MRYFSLNIDLHSVLSADVFNLPFNITGIGECLYHRDFSAAAGWLMTYSRSVKFSITVKPIPLLSSVRVCRIKRLHRPFISSMPQPLSLTSMRIVPLARYFHRYVDITCLIFISVNNNICHRFRDNTFEVRQALRMSGRAAI